MEITKLPRAQVLELRVRGRLDSYWSQFFSEALKEIVQQGAHHLRLDLADVTYLSSAGIGVLVEYYKKLVAIQGSFVIIAASERVRSILQLVGLEPILLAATEASTTDTMKAAQPPGRALTSPSAAHEVFDCEPEGALACRVIGDPALLAGSRYRHQHCRALSFPETAFALGLGAFGAGFDDCRSRFGEFLAVAGSAAYQPGDGTSVPDYMVATNALVPEIETLYGLACEGAFRFLLRFEANRDAGAVRLSELAETCLNVAESGTVGMVMVAEVGGLAGAALRRSPALAGGAPDPFAHPAIREWISFSPERVHARSVCVAAGVVTRVPAGALAPMLRPLRKTLPLTGHFHAAAFSYRPLARGRVDLKPSVAALFENETLRGVLHLLEDDRPIVGVGESELVRGACWVSPITTTTAEGGAA
ncbi:MAG TPA: STAS domain-containing protein [Terriglobales bacterium]|nr:STAS domain-containing protein [Terriglobales bacterium]